MKDINPQKPKVLITNIYLVNFAGSEIDTVTYANWFYKNGYDVDIFTTTASGPILEHLQEGIRVIPLIMVDTLSKEYDLIWSHHTAMLDYVILGRQIKAKKVVYHMLGVLPDVERPPHYAKNLSALLAVSPEVRKACSDLTGIAEEDISILPNYAEDKFFQCQSRQQNCYKKICVVSNHVPQELFDFKQLAEQNGLTVDIYGLQATVQYVDDLLLSQYDAVISIGKTVWLGMAMGKPVYCYDYLGGYGFITTENFDSCAYYNFSGRGSGCKKTAQEILEDFQAAPPIVNQSLQGVKELAKKQFLFEQLISDTMSLINTVKDFDETAVYEMPELFHRQSREVMDLLRHYLGLLNNSEIQLSALNQQAAVLQNQVEGLQMQLTNSQHELTVTKNQLDETNQELAHTVDCLNDVLSSKAFKMTKPIRKLHEIIAKK